ncbi:MAG: hypothetical protein HFF89_09970 [Oscillibacter sp.]|nr:hypothetical protein [Oscillibacter sp.]
MTKKKGFRLQPLCRYQTGALAYESPCCFLDGGKQMKGWQIQQDKYLQRCPNSLWTKIT